MKLKLDFDINGGTARLEYVNDYLKDVDHSELSEDNLEMIANYILWGVQSDGPIDFEIESKNSPWNKGKGMASLEAMIEQERETGAPAQAKVAEVGLIQGKRKLDRAKVATRLRVSQDFIVVVQELAKAENAFQDCFAILGRLQEAGMLNDKYDFTITDTQTADAPLIKQMSKGWHGLAPTWFDLWGQIDRIEFAVQNWEFAHGKRRKDLPIRQELHERLAANLVYSGRWDTCLDRFEAEIIQEAEEWTGYDYLKKKRELVTLRTNQYALLDCLQGEQLMRHMNMGIYWKEDDIGLVNFYPFTDDSLIFEEITADSFKAEFMQKCVKALKEVDQVDSGLVAREKRTIDFRNVDNVRQLVLALPDLEEAALRGRESDTIILRPLVRYLKYYIKKCEFGEDLIYVLRAKIARMSNKEIAEHLKDKFGLEYKENYISTIFTKRIIEAIVEQVNLHFKMIEYITMGEAVFKRCSKCGRLLPRNSTYFNKKVSTSDGFFSSCKDCKTRRKE